jgi:alpha-mannosidase
VSRDARRNWQRQTAAQIEGYVDSLHADAAAALGRTIKHGGTRTRFFAFNPLSWARTDIADVAYSDVASVQVNDLSSGQEVPSQFVTMDGQTYLRVLAEDIPPVGYKVFEVREGDGRRFAGGPSASASTGLMENEIYEVTVAARGAVTSLIDRTRGHREFAANIDGHYINDLGSSSGSLAVENAGPVSVTLRATAARPLEHSTRITLIRGHPRIDIRNDITQGFDDTYTWAFGFDLGNPDVWHEEVGAVVRARLLADGGHYAPRNARYDWLTLNHFADMSGNSLVGVTLSNADCYFMRLGRSTAEFLDTDTAQLSPLVGGQVDGEWLGIPRQGGDTRFTQRFALQTHGAYDPVMAMRFALEHQNPLVTGLVLGGSTYPETSLSLLQVSDPRVLIWAVKPAEDGIDQGIVVRIWNLSDRAASDVTLSCGLGAIEQAVRTTHIETPIEAAKVTTGLLSTSLSGQQLKTFSLQLGELEGSAEPHGVQPTATPSATRRRHRRPAHRR